jgi:hypothetical protein
MKFVVYAAVIGTLAIASSALMAQDAPSPGKACKSDREKFCPGLKPGDGKLGPCMKQHAAELTPECAGAIEAGKQASKQIQANCRADIGKFCAAEAKQRRGIAKCLESHASELEPACADAVNSRPGAKKA